MEVQASMVAEKRMERACTPQGDFESVARDFESTWAEAVKVFPGDDLQRTIAMADAVAAVRARRVTQRREKGSSVKTICDQHWRRLGMPKGGLVSPERWFQERLCEDLLAGGSSVEELEASFRCEISGANARTKKAALAGKTPLAVRAEHLRQQKMERGHNIHSWDLPYFLLKNVMGSTTFCKSGNELFSPPSMVLDDILLGGSTIDDVKSANGNVQNTRFDGQVCNGPTGQRKERLKVDPSPAILRTLQQDLRRAVAHEKEQRDAAGCAGSATEAAGTAQS